jgi:hypothetical protein
MRVKCIRTRANPSLPIDPLLERGVFYEVIDPEVRTIADETPYIRIRVGRQDIERPRHMFGKFLT